MTFTPFPVLETERLLLRQLCNNDTADVFIMRSDPEVMQYIPRPLAVTLDEGIMREALARVLKYGFEHMNLHSVEAITDADNIASGKLLLATGFVQEAFFKEDFYFNGQFRNSIHYGLLRSSAETLGIL